MALTYIDDTGIHLPDYPTVLDHVKGIMHDIYGDDLYIEADSQDGQLCAAFASMMHDTYALCGDVYNAFSPSTAQGVGLSSVVKINGIRRKTASYSTVDLRIVGQVGTIVTGGKAEDAHGHRTGHLRGIKPFHLTGGGQRFVHAAGNAVLHHLYHVVAALLAHTEH